MPHTLSCAGTVDEQLNVIRHIYVYKKLNVVGSFCIHENPTSIRMIVFRSFESEENREYSGQDFFLLEIFLNPQNN